jgi:hypothetical protein
MKDIEFISSINFYYTWHFLGLKLTKLRLLIINDQMMKHIFTSLLKHFILFFLNLKL